MDKEIYHVKDHMGYGKIWVYKKTYSTDEQNPEGSVQLAVCEETICIDVPGTRRLENQPVQP